MHEKKIFESSARYDISSNYLLQEVIVSAE